MYQIRFGDKNKTPSLHPGPFSQANCCFGFGKVAIMLYGILHKKEYCLERKDQLYLYLS